MIFILFCSFLDLKTKRINLFRRNYSIDITETNPRRGAKSYEDSWYFVYFNSLPDRKQLSEAGVELKSENMISKQWYSIFLKSNQAYSISKFSSLRPISQKEKIINKNLIKYSKYIQIETHSTFDPKSDLASFDKKDIYIFKISDTLYNLRHSDNKSLADFLATVKKICAIIPVNESISLNNLAAGYVQYNTQNATLSKNNIVTINRLLEMKGLNGQNESILIDDTFIDQKSTFFYDPAYPDIEYNVTYSDHRKITVIHQDHPKSDAKFNFHGTHVSGCAIGKSHLDLNESDMPLFNGVAPEAKVAFYQSINNEFSADVVEELVGKTAPCACSNSWGSKDDTEKDIWSDIARRINDTLVLFAAGNNGVNGYMSINSPGTAKNVLTVGALSQLPVDEATIGNSTRRLFFIDDENKRWTEVALKKWSVESPNPGAEFLLKNGYDFLDVTHEIHEDFSENNLGLIIKGLEDFNQINKENPPFAVITTSDFDVDDFTSLGFAKLFPVIFAPIEVVNQFESDKTIIMATNYVPSSLASLTRATFSSMGPTRTGLMKPDLMLPGTGIFSARADLNAAPGHQDVFLDMGTSIATPMAAGAAALVSQYFNQGKYRKSAPFKPSGALLRAVLINSADPVNSDEVSPNAETGFGVLNLGNYIMTGSGNADDLFVVVGDRIQVNGSQHLVSEIEVVNNDRDLRITISYLDRILSPDSLSALVVDIDLIVVAPDKTVYRGNQKADDSEEMFSTNERVIIEKGEVQIGTYEIHIISRQTDSISEKQNEFSIAVFGSIQYLRGNLIDFAPADYCVPVKNGVCNNETKLNECTFTDMEIYTGHSCQKEVIIANKVISDSFEIEPFGVEYVDFVYPYGNFSKITVMILPATDFDTKFAYSTDLDEFNVTMKENDFANHELKLLVYSTPSSKEAQSRRGKSFLFTMVYNMAPERIRCFFKYIIENNDNSPTVKPISNSPIVSPEQPDDQNENDNEEDSYLVPFIVVSVGCVIMFVIVIILAVYIMKRKGENNELTHDSLNTSLLEK